MSNICNPLFSRCHKGRRIHEIKARAGALRAVWFTVSTCVICDCMVAAVSTSDAPVTPSHHDESHASDVYAQRYGFLLYTP